jgi:hypothetical protein
MHLLLILRQHHRAPACCVLGTPQQHIVQTCRQRLLVEP